jgi:uncharacterized membrane protein
MTLGDMLLIGILAVSVLVGVITSLILGWLFDRKKDRDG